MIIPKLRIVSDLRPEDVPQALQCMQDVEYIAVDTLNWPDSYPYRPRVEVAMAHTGDCLLVHFRVQEDCIRAIAQDDNGRVWEDSCCELFIQPLSSDPHPPILGGNLPTHYYNIECNCAGTLLVGAGEDRHDRRRASREVLNSVQRWASLTIGRDAQPNGRHTIPLTEGAISWELALIIPASTLFLHQIEDFSGLHMRGNLYKCGDLLNTPHFLSRFPINTPTPDFHRPEFFGDLLFAE